MADNTLSVIRDPDIDGDGNVGLSDAAFIQAALGAAGDDDTDLNTDGVIDRGDIVRLLSFYGSSSLASPAAVPEPSCLALALLGLGAVFAARRRRR